MLVIHGGGWRQDPAAVASERPQAKRFADEGWLVWNVDYRSGAQGFQDILNWHQKLARETRGPICAYGGSAGANFALLLAAERPLDCVIVDGAPTDLAALPDAVVQQFVVPAFGDRTAEFSPLARTTNEPATYVETQILLGHFEGDIVVPIEQAERFADALPFEAPLFELRLGPAPFEHGAVNARALEEYQGAQARLLAAVVASDRFADVPFATERVADIIGMITPRVLGGAG